MKNKKILSLILSSSMIFSVINPGVLAYAQGEGVFSNVLAPVEKVVSNEKFTAKPLVILMDFPDYKYTDLDKKENWRINKFSGEEATPEFYESLFFGDETYKTSDGKEHITVNKFFKEESGGTYEFKGKVVGWYTAKNNAAYYGENVNGSDQGRARELVVEAIEQASKDVDLSEYDIEDKWDLDGDGNYNEPDGIVDSLVVLHAGLGEEWGGGSLEKDAIWPFRWGFNIFGEKMENYTPEKRKEIANKNKKVTDKTGKEYLIEDFTIFEQDLPLDLFNHEFGHVLGLPDLYSTENATPPVENWSIMGGSYTGDPIGSQPVSYGAYCKQFLQKDFEKRGRAANWQKSIEVDLDEINEKGFDVVLDQATIKGKNKEAVRINLPEATGDKVVTVPQGEKCFFSGKGDLLENYMTTKEPVDLTNAVSPELSFKTWYDIDPGFDFASVQVKEVGTENWVAIKDNTDLATDKVDPWIESNEPDSIKDRNPGWGITDSSNKKWLYASFDLSQFKGKKVDFRVRFKTDSNTPGQGIYIDELKIKDGSKVVFSDDAESEKNTKFNFKGFSISDGSERYNHYYLLEWRSSGAGTKVDKGLDLISTYTEGLTYETGLVIWYINEKYVGSRLDQDSNTHPGAVAVGVVDADQNQIEYRYKNGSSSGPDRVQYQLRDAAFSIRPDRDWLLDRDTYVVEDTHTFMNPVFNDGKDYTSPQWGTPTGLKLKNYGLKVFVTEESKDRSTAKIHIAKNNSNDNNKYSVQQASEIKEINTKGTKLYVTPKEKYSDKAYVLYSDINGREKEFTLNYENGKYVCDLGEIANKNIWKINFVVFEDKVGNAKAIYNREINKIYGFDFSKLHKEMQVDIVNSEADFKKGEKTTVTANLNLSTPVDEVTLLVGIYDENDRMLSSSIKTEKGVIALGGKVTINSDIVVPNRDNIKVKVFVWDMKNLNVLDKERVYKVR